MSPDEVIVVAAALPTNCFRWRVNIAWVQKGCNLSIKPAIAEFKWAQAWKVEISKI